MKSKRRKFNTEFKTRVALEAVRGLKTISEIASDNEVHPVQVSKWKKELLEGAPMVFEGGVKSSHGQGAVEKERAILERKIGQLTVEIDWLRKKSKELGL